MITPYQPPKYQARPSQIEVPQAVSVNLEGRVDALKETYQAGQVVAEVVQDTLNSIKGYLATIADYILFISKKARAEQRQRAETEKEVKKTVRTGGYLSQDIVQKGKRVGIDVKTKRR